MMNWLRRMKHKVKWILFAIRWGRRLSALFREAYAEVEQLRYAPHPGQPPAEESPLSDEALTLISKRKRVEMARYIEDELIRNDRYTRRDRRRLARALRKGNDQYLIERIWKLENPGQRPKNYSMQEVELVLDQKLDRPVYNKRFGQRAGREVG